ncbi:hypothetical protein [Mesorhizobium sp.]
MRQGRQAGLAMSAGVATGSIFWVNGRYRYLGSAVQFAHALILLKSLAAFI